MGIIGNEDACLFNYSNLKCEGLSLFEEDGTVETSDKNGMYIRPGREFIKKHIDYFISRDEAEFYKICADLKKILDEYDAKFGQSENNIVIESFSEN